MAELKRIVKRIMVDTADPRRNTTVKVKQYDKGTRYVSVLICENGREYDFPEDATLRVNFEKPDGHYCYNEAKREAGTNGVLVELTSQMLAVRGRAECEVEIGSADASQTLTSAVFVVEIEKGLHNDAAVESSDEMTALEDVEKRVQESAEAAGRSAEEAAESAEAAKANLNNAKMVLFEINEKGNLVMYAINEPSFDFALTDNGHLEVMYL